MNQSEIAERAALELDEMVRDFCKVGPKPKSEVRRRIKEFAERAIAESQAPQPKRDYEEVSPPSPERLESAQQLAKKIISRWISRQKAEYYAVDKDITEMIMQRDARLAEGDTRERLFGRLRDQR